MTAAPEAFFDLSKCSLPPRRFTWWGHVAYFLAMLLFNLVWVPLFFCVASVLPLLALLLPGVSLSWLQSMAARIKSALPWQNPIWHDINTEQIEQSLWFHAPSPAAFESLRPLMREMVGCMSPQEQERTLVVVTYTSSRAQAYVRDALEEEEFPHATSFFLPLDFRMHRIWRWFYLLRPRLIVVAGKDTWPNFFFTAWMFGVPLVRVNADASGILRSGYLKKALRWCSRFFNYPLWLAVCKSGDATHRGALQRYALTSGVPLISLPDTAFTNHSKWRKVAAKLHPPTVWRRFFAIPGEAQVAVAGNIFPSDLPVILPFIKSLLHDSDDEQWWIFLVPFNPQKGLQRFHQELKSAGFQEGTDYYVRSRVLGEIGATPLHGPRIILDDEKSDLPHLYDLADVVYVGRDSERNSETRNLILPLSRQALLFYRNGDVLYPDAPDAREVVTSTNSGGPLEELPRPGGESWSKQYRQLKQGLQNGLKKRYRYARDLEVSLRGLPESLMAFREQQRTVFHLPWWRYLFFRANVLPILLGVILLLFSIGTLSIESIPRIVPFLFVFFGYLFFVFLTGFLSQSVWRRHTFQGFMALVETGFLCWIIFATGKMVSPFLFLLGIPIFAFFDFNPLRDDLKAYTKRTLHFLVVALAVGVVVGLSLLYFLYSENVPVLKIQVQVLQAQVILGGFMYAYIIRRYYVLRQRGLHSRTYILRQSAMKDNRRKIGHVLAEAFTPFASLRKINTILQQDVAECHSSHIMWLEPDRLTLLLAAPGKVELKSYWNQSTRLVDHPEYLCVRSLRAKRHLVVNQINKDAGLMLRLQTMKTRDPRSMERMPTIGSAACFPLLDQMGQPLGVVSFLSKTSHHFTRTRVAQIRDALNALPEDIFQISQMRQRVHGGSDSPLQPDFLLGWANTFASCFAPQEKECRIELSITLPGMHQEQPFTLGPKPTGSMASKEYPIPRAGTEAGSEPSPPAGTLRVFCPARTTISAEVDDLVEDSLNRFAYELHLKAEAQATLHKMLVQIFHSQTQSLGSIREGLELLSDCMPQDATRELAQRILGATRILIRREVNLLAFVRERWIKRPLATPPQPIQPVFKQLGDYYHPMFSRRGVALVVTPPSPALNACLDSGYLFDALENLLINALEASERVSREGVEVRLYCEQSEESLSFVLENPSDLRTAPSPTPSPALINPMNFLNSNKNIGIRYTEEIAKAHGGSLNYEEIEGKTRAILTLPTALKVS